MIHEHEQDLTMNPQPPPYIGNIFAFIFGCLMFYYFVKAYSSKETKSLDLELFTIGYLEEPKTSTINITNNIVKQSKPNFETQQLFIDCVDALVALGIKKTEAKKRTKQIFSSHKPPTSIQDFLMIAMSKDQ